VAGFESTTTGRFSTDRRKLIKEHLDEDNFERRIGCPQVPTILVVIGGGFHGPRSLIIKDPNITSPAVSLQKLSHLVDLLLRVKGGFSCLQSGD
jgi:hypothetical protein